ncbi:MAG: hypothetical protein PHD15_01720 [Clostridia bacterium]|nr:hypothetical protein [Clostridia bacterium]MDD4386469.1 hypothetical protein [Clostridia bacterium]
MKVIGLLGYSEKVDLVTSLSKAIQLMGKTILVIDATGDKKYKYVIPSLDIIEKAYVTQFDNVDYAVGFDSMNDIENYMLEQKINISLYDFILIDIDNSRTYEFFRGRAFNYIYLVMDTSMLGYKKNLEIINSLKVYSLNEDETKVIKILYRGFMTRASEKYIEDKLNQIECKWDEREYEIIESEQDKMLYLDFQISGIIQMKKHSNQFINSIIDIITNVIEDTNPSEVRKMIKKGGI